ncbi:MAG: DUF4412 domain-containing protein [Saprospiraceae bacterium]
MKNFFLLISAVVLFSTSTFAQNFEGVIKIKSTSTSGINGTFYVKGDMVRSEVSQEGQDVVMISNNATGEVTVLNNQNGNKTASKMNVNDLPPQMRAYGSKPAETTFTVTNEQKKVNGYDCYKVIGKGNGQESEAWVTKALKIDLNKLVPGNQGMNGNALGTWSNDKKTGGFPVQITTRDTSGGTVTYDISAEAKKIKDKEFEIDPEYKVSDVSQFMKMMEKMPNNEQIEAMKQKVKSMEEKANATQSQPLPEDSTIMEDDGGEKPAPEKTDGGN